MSGFFRRGLKPSPIMGMESRLGGNDKYKAGMAIMMLVLTVVVFVVLSCSDSGDGDSTQGSIVGYAIRSDGTDHSGITVMLYEQVSLDPGVASPLNQYSTIGFAPSQSCLFDHRSQAAIRTAATNDAGRYAFGELGDGTYNVAAEDSGYGFRYCLELEVHGGEVRADSMILYPIEDLPAQIAANTTWLSGHHYRVSTNITVAAGAMLDIEPGVFVRLGGNKKITIQGTLYAVGEPNNFIHWVRDDPLVPWNQVNLDGSQSGQNQVTWNVFDGGITGLLCGDGSNLNLQRSVLRNFSAGAVSLNNIHFAEVENCMFLYDTTAGLQCSQVDSAWIAYNVFVYDYYGIDCQNNSFPLIQSNWIGHCTEGIFMQEIPATSDTLIITHNQIESCGVGVRVSGSSFPVIKYNVITNCSSRGIRINPVNGGASSPKIHRNNLTNIEGYYIELSLPVNSLDVSAERNWWGTTQNISNLIYDHYDNLAVPGIVIYIPFLESPESGAGITW